MNDKDYTLSELNKMLEALANVQSNILESFRDGSTVSGEKIITAGEQLKALDIRMKNLLIIKHNAEAAEIHDIKEQHDTTIYEFRKVYEPYKKIKNKDFKVANKKNPSKND